MSLKERIKRANQIYEMQLRQKLEKDDKARCCAMGLI